MIFDSNDIEKKIEEMFESKIKNNEINFEGNFCLSRLCWDNNISNDCDKWDLIKSELKEKIRFNYIFDYIKIDSKYNDNDVLVEYVIKTMKKEYNISFNTIILDNIHFKELLYTDFNNYLREKNYEIENNDIENFDLSNYICLFINNKLDCIYNMKHMNLKNEIVMICNILSNIINNNLV